MTTVTDTSSCPLTDLMRIVCWRLYSFILLWSVMLWITRYDFTRLQGCNNLAADSLQPNAVLCSNVNWNAVCKASGPLLICKVLAVHFPDLEIHSAQLCGILVACAQCIGGWREAKQVWGFIQIRQWEVLCLCFGGWWVFSWQQTSLKQLWFSKSFQLCTIQTAIWLPTGVAFHLSSCCHPSLSNNESLITPSRSYSTSPSGA